MTLTQRPHCTIRNNVFENLSMSVYNQGCTMENNLFKGERLTLHWMKMGKSFLSGVKNNRFEVGELSFPIDRGSTYPDVTMPPNYFGPVRTLELENAASGTNLSFVHDFYDDTNLAKVIFEEHLTEPPPILILEGQVGANAAGAELPWEWRVVEHPATNDGFSSETLVWKNTVPQVVGSGAAMNIDAFSETVAGQEGQVS